MSSLQGRNLWKSFPNPQGGRVDILKGVSLTLHTGESVAISGRSGEGKSTLLHILGGLEPIDNGSVTFNEIELSLTRPEIRREKIGFVFQSFHLLNECTVLENILLPARISRRSVQKGSEAWQWGMDLLQRVGLEHRSHFLVKTLSGGEKQRTALARALCNNPDFILADEPSGNLDTKQAQEINTLLFDCLREQNKGLLLVTHDDALAALCQKRLILRDGVFYG